MITRNPGNSDLERKWASEFFGLRQGLGIRACFELSVLLWYQDRQHGGLGRRSRSVAYLPPAVVMMDRLRRAGFTNGQRRMLSGGITQLITATRS